MPALDLYLPLPPSTNHLFSTFVNRKTQKIRRVKTDAYVAWINEAGFCPLAGRWERLTEDKRNRIRWVLHLTVYGLPEGADLVISSSWRGMGLKALRALFERAGFTGPIADITPVLLDPDATRGDEIWDWLTTEEGVGMRDFVILDDDDDLGLLVARLVRTRYSTGLTESDCGKALALLEAR